jgi:hypothetical protein
VSRVAWVRLRRASSGGTEVVAVGQWAELRRPHFVRGLSQREIQRRTGLHTGGTPLGSRRPVGHALLGQPEAEPPRGLLDHRVARQDELRAHLHDGAVGEPPAPHAPAGAAAGLEHDELAPGRE